MGREHQERSPPAPTTNLQPWFPSQEVLKQKCSLQSTEVGHSSCCQVAAFHRVLPKTLFLKSPGPGLEKWHPEARLLQPRHRVAGLVTTASAGSDVLPAFLAVPGSTQESGRVPWERGLWRCHRRRTLHVKE